MKRRDFLRSMEWLAAGALCAATPTFGCSGLRYVPAFLDGDRLVLRRQDMGAEPYVLVEHPRIPRAIYVRRHPDETFTAVLTQCMHLGCQVEPAGDRLACPCHGSEYSHKGEVLRGPTERPLRRYAVTTDAGHIFIHVRDLS